MCDGQGFVLVDSIFIFLCKRKNVNGFSDFHIFNNWILAKYKQKTKQLEIFSLSFFFFFFFKYFIQDIQDKFESIHDKIPI